MAGKVASGAVLRYNPINHRQGGKNMKSSRVITAVLGTIASVSILCATVFASGSFSYEYEYYLSDEEALQMMFSMFQGIMWYFIIGTIIGLIAVIVGVVICIRYKSKQRRDSMNYQYPFQ